VCSRARLLLLLLLLLRRCWRCARARTVHVPAGTVCRTPVCVLQLYAVATPVVVHRLPPGRSVNW
jgi:hypothetical protein